MGFNFYYVIVATLRPGVTHSMLIVLLVDKEPHYVWPRKPNIDRRIKVAPVKIPLVNGNRLTNVIIQRADHIARGIISVD